MSKQIATGSLVLNVEVVANVGLGVLPERAGSL